MDQIPFFFFMAFYATHVVLLRHSCVSASTINNPSNVMKSPSRSIHRPMFVGLNPALQRTITVPNLKVGSVNRGSKVLVGIGGKGQNAIVAASCMETSIKPTLLQFLGEGFEGDALSAMLQSKTDSILSIRTKASCRVCVTLLNGDESTEIIEPSESVLPSELDSLLSTLQAEYTSNKLPSFAIMGSMPKGCPSNLYASIISKCADKDTKVLLDTVAGMTESLKTAASIGSTILLKVNANELLSLAGKKAVATGAVAPEIVLEAGMEFVKSWISSLSASESVDISSSGSTNLYIAVTDGPYPSHLLKLPFKISDQSNDIRQWILTSQPLPGTVVSPIGAGDATSSGTLMHWSSALDGTKKDNVRAVTSDESVVDSFRWGISCGGASCLNAANSVFTVSDAVSIYSGIQVTEVTL